MARRKAGRDQREEVRDELYLGDFEDFVARRNELAKQLRAEGDPEAADHVRALRKPSRTAWAINRFGGSQAKQRDELLRAGAALREAHEGLMAGTAGGADLRSAGEREQAAVGVALEAVGAIALDAGAKLSPATLDRARQTLHAIALDEGVRREFEHHRLTTEHEPAGLGDFAGGTAAASPKRGSKAAPAKAAESKESQRRRDKLKAEEAALRKLEQRHRAAQDEVNAARKDAEEAQRNLDRAAKALAKAADAAAGAREKVEALKRSR